MILSRTLDLEIYQKSYTSALAMTQETYIASLTIDHCFVLLCDSLVEGPQRAMFSRSFKLCPHPTGCPRVFSPLAPEILNPSP